MARPDPRRRGLSRRPIHGLRHVAITAGTSDLDLVRQAVERPARALETVVDGLPHVLLADWAAAFDRSTPECPFLATQGAPMPLPGTAPSFDGARALTVGHEALILASLPHSSVRVLVGRYEGPSFTTSEVQRCAALLDVTATVAEMITTSHGRIGIAP